MRTLKELFERTGEHWIWIYCPEKAHQRRFLQQAEEEGFLAVSGMRPTELGCNELYGIDDESMTMGYVSRMCWFLPLEYGKTGLLRIDFQKYISGEADYRWDYEEYKERTKRRRPE